MTSRQVLSESMQIIPRHHTSVQLSVDERGLKVRNPLHPRAVAWSSVGAMIKVAPGDAKIVAEDKSPGHMPAVGDAYDLLEEAARLQGYANTVEVDRAGAAAARRMFEKALQLAPDERRVRPLRSSGGTGAAPRGATA